MIAVCFVPQFDTTNVFEGCRYISVALVHAYVLQIILMDARQEIAHIALQEIVRLLNEGFNEHPLAGEAHANLIQLITAWQQVQGATLKMKFPPGCPDWTEIQNRTRGILAPSGTGVHPTVVYVGKTPWTAWDVALNEFVSLTFNPNRDKLAGPCARCGKYYIKKRASQKVYCSRVCGNAATAVARTKAKWDEARGAKLELAKKALQRWSRTATDEPFQRWAEDHYHGLTQRFLTRAIRNKELHHPKKRR